MRWRINTKSYNLGDTKVVRKFLLFPMTLNDERRWLEYAFIVYKVFSVYTVGNSPVKKYGWYPIMFTDNQTALGDF